MAVLRYIADSVRCGICQRSFAPDEVAILSEQGDVWFVSIACDECGAETMIVIVLQGRESVAEALPASSAAQEARKPLGPITVAEIDELRRFLQGYHGNLGEFWRADE